MKAQRHTHTHSHTLVHPLNGTRLAIDTIESIPFFVSRVFLDVCV